jgi:hypothetical protein
MDVAEEPRMCLASSIFRRRSSPQVGLVAISEGVAFLENVLQGFRGVEKVLDAFTLLPE